MARYLDVAFGMLLGVIGTEAIVVEQGVIDIQ